MIPVNFKKEFSGTLDKAIQEVTTALQKQGFGILTRIDFHTKIKEKLGKEVPPTVILGACHPPMAYQAYQANSDFTSLMPCNAVIRQVGADRFSIEFTSAEALATLIPEPEARQFGLEIDKKFAAALEQI